MNMAAELDYGMMIAAGGLGVTLATQFVALGKLSGKTEKNGETAKEAMAMASSTAEKLAAYKTEAAEKFASKEQLDMMEGRITHSVEKLGDRIASDMRALGERMDRRNDSHSS